MGGGGGGGLSTLGTVGGGVVGGVFGGPAGAAAGASLGGAVGGMLDSSGAAAEANKQAAKSARASREMIDRELANIDSIKLPDIEKQKIKLRLLEERDMLKAQEIEASQFEQLATDPRFQAMQMQYAQELQDVANQGLTAQDKLVRQQLLDQEAARRISEQSALEQQMMQRGTLDSGAQIAQQIAGQQASAQRGQQAALQMSAQAQQARMAALQGRASLGQQMGQEQLAVDQQNQALQRQLAEFNALRRTEANQGNLQAKQFNVGLQNQQEIYNKGLQQQKFENQLQKQGMRSNMAVGQASNLSQQASAQAQAGAQQQAAGMGLVGSIGGAAIQKWG